MVIGLKKYISFIIIIAMSVSLASCNNSSKSVSNESNSVSNASSEDVSSDVSSNATSIESEETSSKETSSQVVTSQQSSQKTSTVSPSSTVSKSESVAPKTVRITFPEGTSLSKIFDTLESKGVAKQKDLFDTMSTYDFSSYSLISSIAPSAQRCFLLEGYLFPNTYEFYTNEKPQDAIGRLLKVAEKKITAELKNRASELGYSMDQMITLASIIQKEVHDSSQLKKVSSVFHNRLKAGQKLQSDVTITYVEGCIKPYITGDINRYNSFYNTYKCPALPAGPITNPGTAAINAALYPEETEYLYFVTDKAGNYYYAKTYEEHLANCETAGVS